MLLLRKLLELTKWLRDAHVLICRRHVPNPKYHVTYRTSLIGSRIHECACRTWDDRFTTDKLYCLRLTSKSTAITIALHELKMNWIKFASNFNPIIQIFQGLTQRRFHDVNCKLQIQNKTKRSVKFYLNKHCTFAFRSKRLSTSLHHCCVRKHTHALCFSRCSRKATKHKFPNYWIQFREISLTIIKQINIWRHLPSIWTWLCTSCIVETLINFRPNTKSPVQCSASSLFSS